MAETHQIDNDEIDLNELFAKIWRRRVFIFIFTALAVIAVLGISSAIYLKTPAVKTYSESVRFNFPSSIQGTYPSGQRFSKNDLITTVVLKKVYEINDLKSHSVNFDDFSGSFSVSPYAVNSEFIATKFEKLLANKKLTRTEIEEIEKQYQSELKAAQANFALISYVDTKHLGLSPQLVEKILNDIPKVWSEIAIRDLGVLDLKIPGKQFYQPELATNYEYLQGVRYMLNSAKRFDDILKTLQEDEIGGFVRDPVSDWVVSDIQARLASIREFELNPMFSIIANLGLVKDENRAELYLRNEIEVLQDRIDEIEHKAKVFSQAIRLYGTNNDNATMNAAGAPSNGIVQFGDGFLSKLVGMLEQQKDTEYRQSLLTQQIELSLSLQEKNTEVQKLKRALKILQKNSKDSKGSRNELVETYANQIQDINITLSELVNAYQRILSVRNVQVLGKTSALYELAGDAIMVSSDMVAKAKKAITVSVVSGVLAMMLAMFIALVVREKTE